MPGPGGSAPRGVPGPSGCLLLWRCLVPGGLLLGVPGGDPPRMATAAGSMHPTGMHSCCENEFVKDA